MTVAAYVHMASKKDGVHSVKLSLDMLITPTHGSGSMSTRKRYVSISACEVRVLERKAGRASKGTRVKLIYVI